MFVPSRRAAEGDTLENSALHLTSVTSLKGCYQPSKHSTKHTHPLLTSSQSHTIEFFFQITSYFLRNRHIKAYDKTKYAQMRSEIRKQVNEVDNVSRHLMNGTAVFDHWHRRYLVIIYSSNQSADTESREEEERENR